MCGTSEQVKFLWGWVPGTVAKRRVILGTMGGKEAKKIRVLPSVLFTLHSLPVKLLHEALAPTQ